MSEIQFSEDHEWVRVDGDVATIGISNFAQEQLGDVVFVELPAIGNVVVKGDEVAVVESVKAASEVYTPVSGEIIESNDALSEEPSLINASAEADGWFFKIKLADAGELGDLMDADAYAKFAEEQG